MRAGLEPLQMRTKYWAGCHEAESCLPSVLPSEANPLSGSRNAYLGGGGWCLQLICVPPNFLSSLCYFSPLKRSQRKKKKKTQQVSWPLTAGGDAREQPVPLHVMDGSTETACLICSRARAGSMPSNASAALFPLIKTCHFCTWE